MIPSPPNHFVVFADMLGFAALIEAYPVDARVLRASDRPGSLGIEDIAATQNNLLTKAFSSFHLQVKWGIMMAEMREAVTAITFSDSVFFATTSLYGAASFSVKLAHSLLCSRVPVRIGIAAGSFTALRFRSDVSSDSGDHSAQFLGTAVLRAHQTEKCGIKGIRILAHPSLEPFWATERTDSSSKSRPFTFLELPSSELHNAAQVRYELNYWDLAATKERQAWHALQDMWDAAPGFAKQHYQATAEAIDRMRVGQGETALNDLRRRTLPRQPK